MPLVIADLFPDSKDIDKEQLRRKFREIDRKIGTLPDNGYGLFRPGELAAIDDDGLGLRPITQGKAPVSLGGRQVGNFRLQPILLGESLVLRDGLHCGRKLRNVDPGSCLVSFDASADPDIGVLDDFTCILERYNGAGPIQVTSSLTNQHPGGHTRIVNGGAATLSVDVVRGVWTLYGMTEL